MFQSNEAMSVTPHCPHGLCTSILNLLLFPLENKERMTLNEKNVPSTITAAVMAHRCAQLRQAAFLVPGHQWDQFLWQTHREGHRCFVEDTFSALLQLFWSYWGLCVAVLSPLHLWGLQLWVEGCQGCVWAGALARMFLGSDVDGDTQWNLSMCWCFIQTLLKWVLACLKS